MTPATIASTIRSNPYWTMKHTMNCTTYINLFNNPVKGVVLSPSLYLKKKRVNNGAEFNPMPKSYT